MPNISEVFLMDVSKIMPNRTEKFCICISAGDDKYIAINSNHREMYDDFEIKSSNYDFLNHDSYVGCHKTYLLSKMRIVKKLGNLKYEDMKKILDKVKNSGRLPKAEQKSLTAELEKWMENYQENQLKAKFGKM